MSIFVRLLESIVAAIMTVLALAMISLVYLMVTATSARSTSHLLFGAVTFESDRSSSGSLSMMMQIDNPWVMTAIVVGLTVIFLLMFMRWGGYKSRRDMEKGKRARSERDVTGAE